MKSAPVAHTLSSVMSVMGQERTYWRIRIMSVNGGKADEISGKADIGVGMSAFGCKADISGRSTNVRY